MKILKVTHPSPRTCLKIHVKIHCLDLWGMGLKLLDQGASLCRSAYLMSLFTFLSASSCCSDFAKLWNNLRMKVAWVCVCVCGRDPMQDINVSQLWGGWAYDKAVAILILGSTTITLMAIMITVQKNSKRKLLRKTIASMIPQQL